MTGAPHERARRAPSQAASLRPTRLVRSEARLGAGRGRPLRTGLGRLGNLPFPVAPPRWPEGLTRPAPERRIGVGYDTRWARSYPARLARVLLVDSIARPATLALATPTVVGGELLSDLPTPVIFAANHASHADTPLLLATLPSQIRHHTVVGAAADYFFDRRWKAHLWALLLAAIPIERAKIDRRSTQRALELLDDGWNVIIFPEGGRSPDGWGQDFHPASAAYLAVRSGRPVVPVHLSGTRKLLAKGQRSLGRAKTTVTFEPPLWPAAGEDARHFGERIAQAIAVVADERRGDWWTARRNAAAGTTPPLSGPDVALWRRSWALPEDARSRPSRSEAPDGPSWPSLHH
ncbi:MAG: lysophospholipid acyltransferase family protein [Acidimicrobiales bacterium]